MFGNIVGNQQEENISLNAGNPVDFKKIYDATMQMLFKVSYRIVNDEEAAEDLAHDSLIKANEKELVFPSINDAKYWLIRVVKNASINYIKRKERERKAYEKVLYEDHRKADTGEVDLLKKESMGKAREALKKLPSNLQDVLMLREYADLNYKEIGRILGITEGNVKVRIFRAREQLVKIIGEDNVFCPSKDIHSVYLDGELPENYKAEYELHISHCEKCRKELEQLKAVRSLFKADSDALNLDSHFMDESFQRLQIKMAYSRNIGKVPQKSPFKVISYVASGVAAAAVLALVLPLGFKSSEVKAGSENTAAVASTVINSPLIHSVGNGVGSSVPITAVSTGNKASANNVSFDSGRSVVVSGNIQDVVLSSENKKKIVSSFTRNVNDVDVLRPDFQNEAINIKITVPGMGEFPVTTEINLPMEYVSGRR